MTTHINDAGTWRQLVGVFVNDAGTWREIQEVYVNDAGTWRSVFVNSVVSLDASYTCTGNTELGAQGLFGVNASGTLIHGDALTLTTSDTWVTPASTASLYECNFEPTSGTFTGSAQNSWISCDTDRSWSGLGAATLSIRRASDSSVMDSTTITFDTA